MNSPVHPTPLPPPVVFQLEAAEGWLMLDNPSEALGELEQIPAQHRRCPPALELEWRAAEAAGQPARAWAAAHELCKQRPLSGAAWICQAHSLRRLRGAQAAADLLRCVVDKVPSDPVIPYNLACYLAQSGAWQDACHWLLRSFQTEPGNDLKALALVDPDLKSLWEQIGDNFAIRIYSLQASGE